MSISHVAVYSGLDNTLINSGEKVKALKIYTAIS